MKTLYLAFVLFLATLVNVSAQAPVNDLSKFLGKLQTYVATHPRHIKPNMPIAKPEPENPPADMPSLDVSGYMEDPETGLRYYAIYDKIVDPETKYSFHVATGKITLEPIKEKDTAYNGQ
ncbi:hypothetical protein DXT99_21150 [Pontibacter diazotrophicus]|uniref:Uncharacterized protein n=1 Tax=Pontibacter diazotrophicus TaxID=1400979 RepID=A0A3D8L754_9BACT|nr:hypothetical protein [Pontibacter diazotrophicus]RDV13126.1 hypothetical protein DXT99_21150 [Pontibacter diazotrophicus]